MRVVIPSVDYADMLTVTLPAWRAVVPEADLRVVTTAEDRATAQVAHQHGATVIVTDAWTRDDAAFNKAAALDAGFGFDGSVAPAHDEWCLALDADTYPTGPLPSAIEPHVLYGCDRRLCLDSRTLTAIVSGRQCVETLRRRNTGQQGAGYFQLYRAHPGLRYGSFPTAGYYDLAFHQHFRRVEALPTPVLHLGRTDGANWHGRRTIAPWRAA